MDIVEYLQQKGYKTHPKDKRYNLTLSEIVSLLIDYHKEISKEYLMIKKHDKNVNTA